MTKTTLSFTLVLVLLGGCDPLRDGGDHDTTAEGADGGATLPAEDAALAPPTLTTWAGACTVTCDGWQGTLAVSLCATADVTPAAMAAAAVDACATQTDCGATTPRCTCTVTATDDACVLEFGTATDWECRATLCSADDGSGEVVCTDLDTDPFNCGACFAFCASGVCQAGVCQ